MDDFSSTAEEVRAYQEEHQCSVFEAKAILRRRKLTAAVDSATGFYDLKKVLKVIIISTPL